MIATISPADYNYDETIGTQRYASRAKQIKNQPKINEDPKDALLKEYAEEIRKLKEALNSKNIKNGNLSSSKKEQKNQHRNSFGNVIFLSYIYRVSQIWRI